jgi:hydrophobic/amphiphilic exporter-1 (mainly G- bacteria), HAE1 family
MMGLPEFGVKKPVVANLMMLALIGAGLLFGIGLRREFFPEVRPNQVLITAPYPGATPDEVEKALATKIEDRIADLRDLDEINSTVSTGAASIVIEFKEGKDIDAAVADVKREIDALQDLPEQSERIVVSKFEPNLPAIVVALFGDSNESVMKEAIRKIRDDLRILPGMGEIALSGIRTDEIRVEVRPGALIEHDLSLPAVSAEIRRAMQELPGGSVRGPTQNVSIRTPGIEERAADIRRIVVKASGDGQLVRVGDIAEVQDTFADLDLRSRLNGKPAVSLTVFKVGEQDAVEMADMVKAYVAGLRGETLSMTLGERLRSLMRRPGSTEPVSSRFAAFELGERRAAEGELPGEIVFTTDLARFIVGRLELLTRNAMMGLALVFATLLVLLSWRVSLWVGIGLVISLLGTLAVMRLTGTTLNLLTMFGLIIVIGILVDDAIVVAENVKARHEAGEDSQTAAIKGTNQVAWPVVATVLTTIFAFLPFGLIEGRIGDLLSALPVVVACALFVSLIESLFILPPHLAHALDAEDRAAERKTRLWRVEQRVSVVRETFFKRMLIPGYARLLERSLRWRYVTLCVALALVVISAGMVNSGRVRFVFLGSSDAETINGELRMPIGTPASVTDIAARKIEAEALKLPEVKSCWVQVGALSSLEGDESNEAPHLAQVILELSPVEQRTALGQRRSDQVIIALREAIGELVGVRSFRLEEVGGGGSGPPINLGIVGDTEEQIMAATDEMRLVLDGFDGVYDVADNAERGQPELRIALRPGASELGFTVSGLAEQIRGMVYGLEAFTFAGDREDIDVRVVYPEEERRSLAMLQDAFVFSPSGVPVPLAEVATLTADRGFSTIRRLDRERIVTLTADVDTDLVSPEAVTSAIRPEFDAIADRYGVRIVERGRQKDQAESFATLPLGLAVAVGLIAVVLTWLFQSFTQPLIVLMAVPFSVIGMVWGHFLLGFDMTMLSYIGFIALSGIVVNDSLIYVQFYNEQRKAGLTVHDACMAAGRARVRAILLTTVTTVLGLLPLMLEQSFQARFLIPMAITISFGLMSATLLVLVVLPCLLMISSDVFRWVAMLWTGKRIEPPQSVTSSAS